MVYEAEERLDYCVLLLPVISLVPDFWFIFWLVQLRQVVVFLGLPCVTCLCCVAIQLTDDLILLLLECFDGVCQPLRLALHAQSHTFYYFKDSASMAVAEGNKEKGLVMSETTCF